MKPKLGSHVGMSGKEMMLGSAKEAVHVIHRRTTEYKTQGYL